MKNDMINEDNMCAHSLIKYLMIVSQSIPEAAVNILA